MLAALALIYAHIHSAAAWAMRGKTAEAASALREALDMTLPDALYLPFAEHYELIGPLLAKSLFGWENAQALSRVGALAKRTGRDSVSRALPGKGKRDAVAKHRLEDVDREKLDAFAAEKKVGRQRNWNPVVYPQEVED